MESPKENIKKLKLMNRIKSMQILWIDNTKEFCKNTTLHGLSYLINKDLYPMEKTFFAVAFVTVVISAGIFIDNVLTKWSTTPVIFSINPNPTFITNEPFPALTICNMNQAYKSKALKYSKNSTEYAIMQMKCKHAIDINITDSVYNWTSLNQFVTEISQPCENMLMSCRFGGLYYDCNEIFNPIVTDEGLCCAFNMVHPKFMYTPGTISVINKTSANKKSEYKAVRWNAETGYFKKLPTKFYPHKAAGTGESLGLTIVLNVEANEYYCSSSNSIGFKMAIHNPTETPNVREVGLLVAAGYETKARVHIEKLEADSKLHDVHIRYRQCLFQHEHRLNRFATYTQTNCEVEYMANSMMRHCGCISHYMPQRFGNETVCRVNDVKCVEITRLHSMLNDDDDDGERESDEVCLPSCFELRYYAEFFSTPLQHLGFQIANQQVQSMNTSYVKENIAVINMYYKDNSFRSNKQSEFINMTDVLSSVGGLIGLFFGFSFISLAEIAFYTLLRPWRKLRTTESKSDVAQAQQQDLVNSSASICKVVAHPLKVQRVRPKKSCAFQITPPQVISPKKTNYLENFSSKHLNAYLDQSWDMQ